ncbi:hypothetical protein L916_06822 [Phytophthora nicotianae]|uniref:Reverse transcriptase domain-containing protein n=1 Tax=Phytophthora nicotianae TaxID=4792 RepID=W2J9T5_PHYNI|nr:hypothetical protein L916_06822 [Phytophthora nicotianae]
MWIEYLLVQGVMNPVPTSIIAGTLPPDVNLFMDGCEQLGPRSIVPAIREYIRIQFDADELLAIQHASNSAVASFSINVREMLSAVLAVLVWGPHWWHLSSTTRRPLHVRCWIDNMSAVTWIDRHRTSNLLGQELLRVLSCAELEYGVHVSTEHLQGSSNYFADLGTRAWSDTDLRTWTNLTSSWCEQEVPRQFRKIYSARYRFSSGVRSQTLRDVTTSAPGSDGVRSAPAQGSHAAAGKGARRAHLSDMTPYGLSSATLNGVIRSSSDFGPTSNRSTNSYSKACVDLAPTETTMEPYRSKCSRESQPSQTCRSPAPRHL